MRLSLEELEDHLKQGKIISRHAISSIHLHSFGKNSYRKSMLTTTIHGKVMMIILTSDVLLFPQTLIVPKDFLL